MNFVRWTPSGWRPIHEIPREVEPDRCFKNERGTWKYPSVWNDYATGKKRCMDGYRISRADLIWPGSERTLRRPLWRFLDGQIPNEVELVAIIRGLPAAAAGRLLEDPNRLTGVSLIREALSQDDVETVRRLGTIDALEALFALYLLAPPCGYFRTQTYAAYAAHRLFSYLMCDPRFVDVADELYEFADASFFAEFFGSKDPGWREIQRKGRAIVEVCNARGAEAYSSDERCTLLTLAEDFDFDLVAEVAEARLDAQRTDIRLGMPKPGSTFNRLVEAFRAHRLKPGAAAQMETDERTPDTTAHYSIDMTYDESVEELQRLLGGGDIKISWSEISTEGGQATRPQVVNRNEETRQNLRGFARYRRRTPAAVRRSQA